MNTLWQARPALARARVAGLTGLVGLMAAAAAHAEVVVLQSGFDEQNAVPWSVGDPDPGLTYITTGSASIGFASPFTAVDFAAAQAGPAAITKAALAQGNFPIYVPSLFAAYPGARWVNMVAAPLVPRTLLYAMPFQLATPNITSASLSLNWAVDDWLGDPASTDPNPVGVYLNGQPVPSGISAGTFGLITTAFDPNIGPLLQTGQNWIYLYQRDLNAGASGLLFGATISVVPEPGTGALLWLGGLAAWGLKRRGRAAQPAKPR
jgi:hypothetical protein